jgi:PTS system nitrogen regulatory IIA component
MMIKAADVAELMQIDEKTVVRWIRKEGLDAVELNGGYQINRVDLLEWATEHGIKVPLSLFVADDKALDFPTLTEALEAGGVYCGVPGNDKLSVLENLVANLSLPPQVDPEFLLQVLLAREALGTTAVGDGIAIPHVRNPILVNLPSPAITLSFLEQPVDFGALDGKPVEIVFMLISPTVKIHLHLLSKLAYALRNDTFRSVHRCPCDPALILDAARRVESDLGR